MALSLLDQFGGAQADARKRLSAVQEAQQQPMSVRRGGLRGRRGWTLWGSNQLGST